jgi:DNA-binding response OmpR family regulator
MTAVEPLVLIIEDDPMVAHLLGRAFALGGYQTVRAPSGAAARRALKQHRPTLITLDLYLPDCYGLDLLAQLRAEALIHDAPVVVITTDTTALRSAAPAVAAVLLKPFSIGELLDTAASLIDHRARALGE